MATEAISKNERPMNLHPLLLLLSRLYPSSLEGCESNLQLSVFLPFILKCSVSPELETRKLAVKSMVALIPPHQIFEQHLVIFNHLKVLLLLIHSHAQLMQFILKESIEQPIRNSNTLHGYLLQQHSLIKCMNRKQIENTGTEISTMLRNMLKLNLFECGNYILIKVYSEILVDVLLR